MLGLALLCTLGVGHAEAPRPPVSYFGGVGLLQMPSARFADDGELQFGGSVAGPDDSYSRYFMSVQALPWLESTLGYKGASEADRDAGADSYKHLDAKIALLPESRYIPALALGARDLTGSGPFSGEYLVASKRYYNWDFSLGRGFGGLASDDYLGLFGGVSYQTAVPGLSLQLELDGDIYQARPSGNRFAPVNLGLTYRPNDWLDLSVGLERSDTLMAQLVLHTNLHRERGIAGPGREPERLRPRPAGGQQAGLVAESVMAGLSERGYQVEGIAIEDAAVEIHAAQDRYRKAPQALGRLARVAANRLPPEIEQIRLVELEQGLATARVSLYRKDLENALTHRGSPEEVWINTSISAPALQPPAGFNANTQAYPRLSWSLEPRFRQHLGEVDSSYAHQLSVQLAGNWQINRHLGLSGALALDVHNNLDQLAPAAGSRLPRVRSEIQQYLEQGANGIERLELNYLWRPAQSLYARISAGLFEEMYGGLGGELLYRPFGERWALGTDINWVKQRGFDKGLSFLDYQTVTGHASLYYDVPLYNLDARLSAGRYLARDWGMTLDISRAFGNGTRVGIFASHTDAAADEPGQEDWGKGVYLSVPLDLFSVRSRKAYAGFGWRPLNRDGGQMLGNGQRLHPLTHASRPHHWGDQWHSLLD